MNNNNNNNGINLEVIQSLNSYKEIIDYIVECSYEVKYDNLHEKSYNSVGWSKAYGCYLVAKKVKKEDKQTDLDILFLSAEKKARTIFTREMAQNGDMEEYSDRGRLAVLEILNSIYEGNHNKYPINKDINKFKALFATKECANRLTASILATLNNKFISEIRNNKTTNIEYKRVYNGDGTFKDVYTTVNMISTDAKITNNDDSTENILDNATKKAIATGSCDIGNFVTIDNDENDCERIEGITKYISQNIDTLTTKQQKIFIDKYSDLGLGEEDLKYIMEHSDIKSISKQLYSQSSKKTYRDNIQKNIINKLKDDENVKIEFDENRKLKNISKRFNEKHSSIDSILACKDNKAKLDKLVSYLSKNDYTANLLSDILYDLPSTTYRPIVFYINSGEVSNKYLYIIFKEVIKALEQARGAK